jgi:lysophospholipase L1-like esterase
MATSFTSAVVSRKGFYGPMYGIPLSVGAIGDSITANCMPNVNMQTYIVNSTPASAVTSLLPASQAQVWAVTDRRHSWSSWLLHGALRSKRAWFPFEFIVGGGGYTSANILNICLPTLLNNPNYGLPNMCVVLAGTNDLAQSVPVATTIANIKLICQRLSEAGIVPIIASCPPPLTSASATLAVNTELLALAQCRLAQELNVPFADFYSALVEPASGKYALCADSTSLSYCINTGDLHPSPLGASIMGYALNNAIQTYCAYKSRLMPCTFDTATITYQNRNPGFTSITGTVNVTGSYPSTSSAFTGNTNAPTVYNSSGTEPGSVKTMYSANPALNGVSQSQNYVGNSFCMQGNVGNTSGINVSQDAFTSPYVYSTRDKFALSARIRSGFDMTAATGATCALYVQNNGSTNRPLFGILPISYNAATQTVGIGNETDYAAGDLYLEYTLNSAIPTGNYTALYYSFGLGGAGGAVTGTSNYVCFANVELVNLTAGGIVAP